MRSGNGSADVGAAASAGDVAPVRLDLEVSVDEQRQAKAIIGREVDMQRLVSAAQVGLPMKRCPFLGGAARHVSDRVQ